MHSSGLISSTKVGSYAQINRRSDNIITEDETRPEKVLWGGTDLDLRYQRTLKEESVLISLRNQVMFYLGEKNWVWFCFRSLRRNFSASWRRKQNGLMHVDFQFHRFAWGTFGLKYFSKKTTFKALVIWLSNDLVSREPNSKAKARFFSEAGHCNILSSHPQSIDGVP